MVKVTKNFYSVARVLAAVSGVFTTYIFIASRVTTVDCGQVGQIVRLALFSNFFCGRIMTACTHSYQDSTVYGLSLASHTLR